MTTSLRFSHLASAPRLSPTAPTLSRFASHSSSQGKTFDVTIAGTRGDSGADEVRSLYATVIPGMHPRDLFVFFQRARFVAGERMARVGNNFAQVSAYDLQAVFKLLETARELAYQRYFQPDAAVNQ